MQRLILRHAQSRTDSVTRKRQRKFARHEREALRCGDDVQRLQRFVDAQIKAFRKVLKKYRVRASVLLRVMDLLRRLWLTRHTEMDRIQHAGYTL